MAYLTEVASFVENVLRLDLDTPVKGFDGSDIGPSNEQAQVLANRTLWLKENFTTLKTTVDGLKNPDNVMADHLGASDPHPQYLTKDKGKLYFVDKESANKPGGYIQLKDDGTAPDIIADLFHSRYEIVESKTERLALEAAPDITICLQTDENTVYYLNTSSDPSVESNWKKGQNTAAGSGAISVFGRTGVVEAKAGDYTADLITETDNRTFVSNDDRTKWDNKQDKLISGTDIKTINGESLLGASDITITANNIGAADKEHTHKPSEIETDLNNRFVTDAEKASWNAKQDKLVSGVNISTVNGQSLLSGNDVTIDVDVSKIDLSSAIKNALVAGEGIAITSNDKKITITNTVKGGGNSGSGGSTGGGTVNGGGTTNTGNSTKDVDGNNIPGTIVGGIDSTKTSFIDGTGMNVVIVDSAKANTAYEYSIPRSTFNVQAYGLKYIASSSAKDEIKDTNYLTKITPKYKYQPISQKFVTSNDLVTLEGKEVTTDYETYATDEITIEDINTYGFDFIEDFYTFERLLPANMNTSDYTVVSRIPYQSYNEVYRAFHYSETEGDIPTYLGLNRGFAVTTGSVTDDNTGKELDAITLTSKIGTMEFDSIGMQMFNIASDPSSKTKLYCGAGNWKLYGKLGDGDWEEIEIKIPQPFYGSANVTTNKFKIFYLGKTVSYDQLKFSITSVNYSKRYMCIRGVQLLKSSPILIKTAKDNYYRYDSTGTLIKVEPGENMFDGASLQTSGIGIELESIKDELPIKLCSNKQFNVLKTELVNYYSGYYASNSFTYVDGADAITINHVKPSFRNDNDGDLCRALYSVDNYENCYTFKDGSWVNVGKIDITDPESVTRIYDNGFVYSNVVEITASQWKELTEKGVGSFVLRDIYSYKTNVNNVARSPRQVTYSLGGMGEWQYLSPNVADLVVTIGTGSIKFTPKTAGNYRFHYRFD